MIKLIKTAVGHIGIGLVLLGVIIVYGTLRASHFNGYILGTGILLIFIPLLVYLVIEKTTYKEGPKDKQLNDLKLSGIKVPVDLTKCIVKSSSWTTEVERYDSPRIVFLNEVSGHSDKNVARVESNLSRIEYSCDFNGMRRTFISPAIAKDEVTITLLMEIQKETAIYIDRHDNGYYYFDLEFINK